MCDNGQYNKYVKNDKNINYSTDCDTFQCILNSKFNSDFFQLPFKQDDSEDNYSNDFNIVGNVPDLENILEDDYPGSPEKPPNQLDLGNITDNLDINSGQTGPQPKTKIEKIFSVEKESKNNNNNVNIFINSTTNKREIKRINKKRERFDGKRKRFKNNDNILRKIATSYINKYLLNALNKKSEKIYFQKAHIELISSIVKKKDEETNLNTTLRQYFTLNNLYKKQLDLLENGKNEEISKILDTPYFDLFKEYINSDDFKIKEINRIKKNENTNNEWYINRYIFLSENFFEFTTKN